MVPSSCKSGFFCLFSPRTSSQFCRDSARSLVAAYNSGALPCNCDPSGSIGPDCDPVGGQCPCRQHIIGRQCTRCATGFYGFPYCRRESTFTNPNFLAFCRNECLQIRFNSLLKFRKGLFFWKHNLYFDLLTKHM